MYISPSKIQYINCSGLDSITDLAADTKILELSSAVKRGCRYPKLQIVKKDGYYFTLNDTKLRFYRHLEKLGQCGKIRAERVSFTEVPEGIRKLMRPPDVKKRRKGKGGKKRKGKYQRVHTTDVKTGSLIPSTGQSDEDDDTDCDDSDDDDTDWSDEDPSDTDLESSESSSEDDDDDDDEQQAEGEEDKLGENESFI